jgi:hypothetical protein
MKALSIKQWSRESTIFVTTLLIGAFLFIAVTTYGASVVGSTLGGVGTTTPLWGDFVVEQASQGRLKGVLVVGDTGTTTPTMFISQKGVIAFGSSTPSPIFLNQGDVVIGRNGSTNDLYVSGGLGVGNATTTDNDLVVGLYRFSVFASDRIGMLGTSSPAFDTALNIGTDTAGTNAHLYVSGGLGVANATSSTGDFIIRAADPIFSFTSNGRLVVGATSTALTATGAPNKFVFDGGQAVFSSGGTGSTTLSVLSEAGADGQNGCIELSSDGLTYALYINGAGTGVEVSQKSCGGN